MGLFTFTSNILVLVTLLYHILVFHKNKMQKTKNKNHPYVFIIMSVFLSFERIFSFLHKFNTWYWMKFLFIFLLCFPGSTLGHKLYKEYLLRGCVLFGDHFENACAKGIAQGYGKVKVYVMEVVDYVNQLVKRENQTLEAIEFTSIQSNVEEIKKE